MNNIRSHIQKQLSEDEAWLQALATLEARLKAQLDEQRRKIHDVKIGALTTTRVYVKPHRVPSFEVSGHYRTLAVGPVTQARARKDRRVRDRGVVLPLL